METKQIIYLVAFALVLRVIIRVIVRMRKEQKGIEPIQDSDETKNI